jgi:hypothetical protein
MRHGGRPSGRKTFAALGTATRQHAAPSGSLHTLAKAVAPLANKPARLIGALHISSPVSRPGLYALGNRPDRRSGSAAVVRFAAEPARIAGAYMGQAGPKSMRGRNLGRRSRPSVINSVRAVSRVLDFPTQGRRQRVCCSRRRHSSECVLQARVARVAAAACRPGGLIVDRR